MGLDLSDGKLDLLSYTNGIRFYEIRSHKFKTNCILVCISDELNSEKVTFNSILPSVLIRGCKSYPTSQNLFMKLESLYGATFDAGVIKKGEHQILQFYAEYISGKYLNGFMNITKEIVDLLYEVIANPIVENKAFIYEWVEQEKSNLKNLISGRVNDKFQYAIDKCIEEMCKNEPFSICEKGILEKVDSINCENLYEYYYNFIRHAPIDIYICGEYENSEIEYLIRKFSEIDRSINLNAIKPPKIKKNIKEIKQVNQIMNIEQSKLSLGFRTNTSPSSYYYYAQLLYNSILAGGTYSKLFGSVREKMGLAYYAISRLEKFKGILIISCGIDSSNKEKAFDVIIEQMDDIRKGCISDHEYESALKDINAGINYIKDNQLGMMEFYISQSVAGTQDNINSIYEKIKVITKEEIVKFSESLKLDTVYFLTPR